MRIQIDVATNLKKEELNVFCKNHNFPDSLILTLEKVNRDLIVIDAVNATSVADVLGDLPRSIIPSEKSNFIIIIKLTRSEDVKILENMKFIHLNTTTFGHTLLVYPNIAGKELVNESTKEFFDMRAEIINGNKYVCKQIRVKEWMNDIISARKEHGYAIANIIDTLSRVDTISTILYIQNYNGTQAEKEQYIERIINTYKDKKDYVIVSRAYASLEEDKIKINKKPVPYVPYDMLIKRESKMLESLGFQSLESLGFLTNNEIGIVYIYRNELGKKVCNYLGEFDDIF